MLRALVRSYRDAFSGLPRQVWVLASCLFVNRVGMMVLPFLALYLTDERGYGVDAAGRMVSLYGVGSILGVTAGGWLADRFGPRRVQLASLTLNALFLVVLGHARSTLALGAAILATSTAADTFRPANGAAISAAVGPGSRARAFSLMSLAVSAGLTFGLPLGGALAELDFEWLFWIDAGTALLAGAVLFAFGERGGAPARDALAPRPAAVSPWRDGHFLAFVALQCATSTVLFQFFGALPVFLKRDLGFDEGDVGASLAVNSILIALFEMQLVRRIETRPPLPLVALGSFVICAGYGVNAFARGPLGALASIAVWTLGEMFFFPLAATFATTRAPSGAVGRYLSVFQLGFAVPFVLAPLVGTALYDQRGPRFLWASCAGMGLLVAAFHWTLRRSMARSSSPRAAGESSEESL
jgi:predicted MFS family arabinose efflux permease